MRVEPPVSLLLFSFVVGCASTPVSEAPRVVENKSQAIALTVIDADGSTTRNGQPLQASCVARNDKGQWDATAPGTVVVTQSSENLVIDCKVNGLVDGQVTVAPRRPAGPGTRKGTGPAFSYAERIQVIMGRGYFIDSH